MNLIPRSYFFDDFFDNDVRIKDMKCDIYEQDNNYVVEMDIPGCDKDNINIDIDRGYLTIILDYSSEDSDDERTYIRRERFYGTTKRSFYVGDVDEDSIRATFNNGVLKVIVPRRDEESTKRNIEIE